MSIIITSQIIALKKVRKHKWAYAYKEPTEQKAICVNCGAEMTKSRIGGKNCTRVVTVSGEVFDLHFGDKMSECK